MNILELKNINKSFNRKTVLERLNFSLKAGSITSLIGHNGAGKSTTIKLILNLLRPDSGEILLFGSPFRERALSKIGYLPEIPVLPNHLSGQEFLYHICDYFNLPTHTKKRLIPEVLNKVGLAGKEHLRIKAYSKGMRQRLGFGQAIINQPELLILDEPFSGLDPHGVNDVREMISGLKSPNTTVLISSHMLGDLKKISDRHIMLAKGKILEDIENFAGDIEALYLTKFPGGCL